MVEVRLNYVDRFGVAPASLLGSLYNRLGSEERRDLIVLQTHDDKGEKEVIGIVVGRIMPTGSSCYHIAPLALRRDCG